MFVQNQMTTRPQTVGPDETAARAAELMREHRFHQLPVIDGNGNLIGIVTDRDVRSAIGYDASSHAELRVEEIMTTEPRSINQDATLEEALIILNTERFNALPVINGRQVVGILTKQDIIRAFCELLGLNQAGRRIEVALPHGIKDIADIVTNLAPEDQISCLIAARLRMDGEEPVLYLRTRSMAPGQVERRPRAHGAILLAPEQAPLPPD